MSQSSVLMSAPRQPRPLSLSHEEDEWRVASGINSARYADDNDEWNRPAASLVAASPRSSFPNKSNSFSIPSSTSPQSSPGVIAPRIHRVVTDAAHANGLTITPMHDVFDDQPLTAPSISISEKLRSLKLKSRAGRAPSAAGSLGVPDARNTRAASAFVRRQPSLDELEQHLSAFDLQRPSSNLGLHPTSAGGSLTPSADRMQRNPFAPERDLVRDSIDSIGSTNSSYENLTGAGSSALGSLRSRRDRKQGPVPPISPTGSTSTNSSASFSGPSGVSLSPMPLEREVSNPRRPRFTSEPVAPMAHLQMHAPSPQTAFGAARLAHQVSLAMAEHQPQTQMKPHPHSASHAGAGGHTSLAQQFASLMDEVDGHDYDAIAGSPRGSSAFDLIGSASGSPSARNRVGSPSFSQQSYSPQQSYDDRPIGGRAQSHGTATAAGSGHTRDYSDEFRNARWDMTPAQAAAMTNDFSLPAPVFSLAGAGHGGSSGAASAPAKRTKPISDRPRPSLSITPSAGGLTSLVGAGGPLASPPPLISPARPRNPRVNTATPTSAGPLGSPSSSLSGGSEEGTYVASADLQPYGAPAAEVTNVFRALQSSEWSVRFDGITSLRRLLVHHPTLVAPQSKSIVRDLRAEVNSLRSSLAKNALMALSDGFTGIPKALETELEQVGPSILKRAGEPSGFLRDEAHRALLSMISHCSDRYTIPFLLNASTTGTKIVKTMACVYIDRAVDCYGSRGGGAALQANKEWSRLLKAIGTFSSDAAVESRTHSRWSLIRLARVMGLDELDRTMKKMLPAAHYHAVNKVLGKGMEHLNMELATAAITQMTPAASAQPSPTTKRLHAHTSISLPAGQEFEGNGTDAADAPLTGVDSVARKRRGKLPTGLSNSGDRDAGWNSVKSAASSVTGGGAITNGNLFDLDNPEYNTHSLASATSSASASRASAKRRPTTSVPSADADRLTGLMTELSSGDWRTRMAAIEKLKAFVQACPQATAGSIGKIFDMLQQRINDHHGKVNVAALQSLPYIIPVTKPYLCSVLGSFIPSLATNLASTNPQIRQLCQSGLDQLLASVETPQSSFTRELQSSMMQPFAQVALFENVKIRPLMIEKLTAVVSSCADAADATGQPPSLATFKSVIPVAYSLCEETRTEIKTPLLKFTQLLYAVLGAQIWDEKILMQFHISTQQVAKLKQMLNLC